MDFSNTYRFLHTDPFDLNHNLGAGLSRKSKLPGPQAFRKFAEGLDLFRQLIFFLLFPSDKFYNEGFYQWQKGIWYPNKRIS